MADHGKSGNYPPDHLSTGEGGTGLFWVLFVIAGLGVLVLIGSLGGGSITAERPGGVGVDPITVPADNAVVIE